MGKASAPVAAAKRQVICGKCKRANITLYRVNNGPVSERYRCKDCR